MSVPEASGVNPEGCVHDRDCCDNPVTGNLEHECESEIDCEWCYWHQCETCGTTCNCDV